MVKNGFTFFDETSTEYISNSFHNSDGSALMMQVSGDVGATISFQVKGVVDVKGLNANEEQYVPINCINMSNFKTTNKITQAGTYMLITEGIFRIRCEAELSASLGSFKVFANVI